MLYIMKFDENSNLDTIYLSKENMSRLDKLTAEERFPIMEQGYST